MGQWTSGTGQVTTGLGQYIGQWTSGVGQLVSETGQYMGQWPSDTLQDSGDTKATGCLHFLWIFLSIYQVAGQCPGLDRLAGNIISVIAYSGLKQRELRLALP